MFHRFRILLAGILVLETFAAPMHAWARFRISAPRTPSISFKASAPGVSAQVLPDTTPDKNALRVLQTDFGIPRSAGPMAAPISGAEPATLADPKAAASHMPIRVQMDQVSMAPPHATSPEMRRVGRFSGLGASGTDPNGRQDPLTKVVSVNDSTLAAATELQAGLQSAGALQNTPLYSWFGAFYDWLLGKPQGEQTVLVPEEQLPLASATESTLTADTAHTGSSTLLAQRRSGTTDSDHARASDGTPPPIPTPIASSEAPSRIPALDAVRGLAIFGMIPRNLAGILLGVENPIWFIAMGALVPALFMLINGFVITHSVQKKYTFSYYILRGARLFLLAGILVDAAIWTLVPFQTVDVLTTISLLIPIIYLVQKLPSQWQLLVGALAFLASFPLQYLLGYAAYPTELKLVVGAVFPLLWGAAFIVGNEILKRLVLKNKNGRLAARIAGSLLAALLFAAPLLHIFSLPAILSGTATKAGASAPVWHHYLVDGWFPLFPWLGFGILGSTLASRFRELFKKHDSDKAHELAANFFKNVLKAGLLALVAGIAAWLWLTPNIFPRGDYTIPIFPPTWQYLLLATGGLWTIVGGFYILRDNPYLQRVFSWLQTMGRRSLEIYVLHLALGQILFYTLLGLKQMSGWPFAGVAALTVLICYAVAALLEKIKATPWL